MTPEKTGAVPLQPRQSHLPPMPAQERAGLPFPSLYRHGFARVAACATACTLAQPAANAEAILGVLRQCHDTGAVVAVFPELALSGYAIDDLLLQDVVLDGVTEALKRLAEGSRGLRTLAFVGAPLSHAGRLYNTAAAIHDGQILGVVPKSFLPNYREFYEKRHFAAGANTTGETLRLLDRDVAFGTDLLFEAGNLRGMCVHAEICEDLWVPVPPSAEAALAGATVLVNLSASNITIGKSRTRTLLCRSQASRCVAAYCYAAAGGGESTTDLAWDGQAEIFELDDELARTDRFSKGHSIAYADVDLDRLRQERQRVGSFDDNARAHASSWRRIAFSPELPATDIGLRRAVARFPFVPADKERLAQDCYEAYHIQVSGLTQRMRATGSQRLVMGISGGLDSTQALLVAAKAFDELGLPRSQLLTYTLPGFATSERTKTNALRLMHALGTDAQTLDIRPAAMQMLRDLDHPYADGEPCFDTTFENVQAGLRTDYLFRLANRRRAFVLGTGDLSELALGWCTYGVGDQMSHYNVNAGVPKTLMQHLLRWVIDSGHFGEEVGPTLQAVLDTEISPELIPPSIQDAPQSTEQTIGPYDLQDFHLYYILRYGYAPSKIAFLAWRAWADIEAGEWPPGYPGHRRRAYPLEEIRHWLEVFLRRFFGFAQFKRSAMPNGPKVTAGGSLSPRGDWRAPSDSSAKAWLEELQRNVPETL